MTSNLFMIAMTTDSCHVTIRLSLLAILVIICLQSRDKGGGGVRALSPWGGARGGNMTSYYGEPSGVMTSYGEIRDAMPHYGYSGTEHGEEGPVVTRDRNDGNESHSIQRRDETLKRKIIISTVLEAPYMMFKANSPFLAGNERFEGFLADILRQLSLAVGFQYEIRLSRDGKHGDLQPNGNWDGTIGEVLSGEADIAAAALIITEARKESVHFSVPFLSLRSSALILKPASSSSSFSSSSSSSSSASHQSPSDNTRRRTSSQSNRTRSQQHNRNNNNNNNNQNYNYDVDVNAGSQQKPLITTVDDLLRSDLTYGVVTDSVAHRTLSSSSSSSASSSSSSSSSDPVLRRTLWTRLNKARPSAFVSTIPEGVDRARRERYAFIVDTPLAEYLAGREPCDLYATEPFLDVMLYAFALRRPSADPDLEGRPVLGAEVQKGSVSRGSSAFVASHRGSKRTRRRRRADDVDYGEYDDDETEDSDSVRTVISMSNVSSQGQRHVVYSLNNEVLNLTTSLDKVDLDPDVSLKLSQDGFSSRSRRDETRRQPATTTTATTTTRQHRARLRLLQPRRDGSASFPSSSSSSSSSSSPSSGQRGARDPTASRHRSSDMSLPRSSPVAQAPDPIPTLGSGAVASASAGAKSWAPRRLAELIDRELRRMLDSSEMRDMYMHWWRNECRPVSEEGVRRGQDMRRGESGRPGSRGEDTRYSTPAVQRRYVAGSGSWSRERELGGMTSSATVGVMSNCGGHILMLLLSSLTLRVAVMILHYCV